ncbi:MAG: hypothetical protein V6Z89_25885 [Desulfobacter sp.]
MASVENIKQIIQAMDSPIQAGQVRELDKLLALLGQEIQENAPAVSFLKMMRSTARYLAAHIHTAHPDTMPVLVSLARDLDMLLRTPPPLPGQADEILARGIRSFKIFKARASAPHISAGEMEALKAVILSIDWEISHTTLKSFDRVVTGLKKKTASSKIHHTFLRILHGIVADIARNKADAHKDSIHLLHTVFEDFEQLVQAPDMAPGQKKQMIERDIAAYNRLKKGINASQAGTVTEPAPAPSDEEISPALSHISTLPPAGEPAPLSALPAREMDTVPIASKTKDSNPQPTDVMGDLFSPKPSPADKLLDAIHLADVHGTGQETAAMAAMAETGEGIKNFTPLRTDKAPIPEIESRLDAFFNQEFPETATATTTASIDGTDKDDPADTLTYAPEEDEFVDAALVAPPELPGEELPDDAIVAVAEDDARAHGLMERLEAALSDPGTLGDAAVFNGLLEDLFVLKQLWGEDEDKTRLLTLLAGISQYIHGLEPETAEQSPDTVQLWEAPDTDDDRSGDTTPEDDLSGDEHHLDQDLGDQDSGDPEPEYDTEPPEYTENNGISGQETPGEDPPEQNEPLGDADGDDVAARPKGFFAKIRAVFRR